MSEACEGASARADDDPQHRRDMVRAVPAISQAAEKGELDKDFPTLTLLEYDLDVDGSRLSKAGYAPGCAIPYRRRSTAKPTQRATASAPKGEGAVEDIADKLRELLR